MTDQTSAPVPEPTGIVSVNSRGGTDSRVVGKVIFAIAVLATLGIGLLMGVNKYRAMHKADDVNAQTARKEDPPADAQHHVFNTDPPPLPGASHAAADAQHGSDGCPDHADSRPLLGPDGKPMSAPSGQTIRVCPNGQLIVPALQTGTAASAAPVAVVPNGSATAEHAAPPPSRYAGDVLLAQSGIPAVDPNNPFIQALLNHATAPASGMPASALHTSYAPSSEPPDNAMAPHPAAAPASPQGALKPLLQASQSGPVQASMIGDRDMILPEGRTIDCNLSLRLINEVSGKATCVLSSNVYSDNGHVVLAERGSVANGEYVAMAAQGQRRLFILWTRLETPKGVVIALNSPAADELGTSGLAGYVDQRWADRIGAAVLLSMVQDAIGYETAKASAGNGSANTASGIAIFQNTTQTGNQLAERILESTINIKPTIYKNQGDRATIFVARDLDFGSVYALRAQ